MPSTLVVVMDPIHAIHSEKDSTLAMLREAQTRGWRMRYATPSDLSATDGRVAARARDLQVFADPRRWFALGDAETIAPGEADVILMRKDPPFDMEYVYTTYLLELAGRQGAWVINDPRALRDCNEKLFTAWFPQCCPPTMVSRRSQDFVGFLNAHGRVVVKPLDGMGGQSVFILSQHDDNRNVIIETLTNHGRRFAMAQKYLPEIAAGDKRILLIDGEPVPYALARVPRDSDSRGNLAAGATANGVSLTARDVWLCEQIAPALRERGLVFVGIDVIGDYITEINVTSPTCIRELDRIYDLNIAATLFDVIERRLQERADAA